MRSKHGLYPYIVHGGREHRPLTKKETLKITCKAVARYIIGEMKFEQTPGNDILLATAKPQDILLQIQAEMPEGADKQEIIARHKKIQALRMRIIDKIKIELGSDEELLLKHTDDILGIINNHYKEKQDERSKDKERPITKEDFERNVDILTDFCLIKLRECAHEDKVIACEPQVKRIQRRIMGATNEQYEHWQGIRNKIVEEAWKILKNQKNVRPDAAGGVSQDSELVERILEQTGKELTILNKKENK